jgi:predicted RecB family nuclease
MPLSPSLVITPSMLRLFKMCPRRVWLDQYGDSDTQDGLTAIATLRFKRGADHERMIHEATTADLEHIPVSTWSEAVQVTEALMGEGAALIIGACLERTVQIGQAEGSIIVSGKVDRLVRLPYSSLPSRLRGSSQVFYAPIEIKQYTNTDEADDLQLDFYIWLLSLIQGFAPYGEFWLGRDSTGNPLERVRHEVDEARLMKGLQAVIEALEPSQAEPPIVIRPHCKTCHWYSACRAIAAEKLDVSILSGLRSDSREHLRRAGIRTLDQIAALEPAELRQFKGIKSKAEGFHAHARAWLERQPIWYNPLPESCRMAGFMFDIETDPMTGAVWCLGWGDADGTVQVALVGDVREPEKLTLTDESVITVVPDSEAVWRVFAENVSHSNSPLYHWTAYDASMMRKTAPEKVVEQLNHRLHDLHYTFNQSVKFPIFGSSLKTAAAYLGFKWSVYEAWDQAFNDYQSWLATGDVSLLTQACAYQRDDVVALAVVWKWLMENAS